MRTIVMWKEAKGWYSAMSLAVLFAVYVVFMAVYALAYLTAEGKVIFDVNHFHEKHIEAFLFLVTAPGVYRIFTKGGEGEYKEMVKEKLSTHNMRQSHALDNIKYRKNDSVFRSVSKRGSSAQFFPFPTQFSSNFYIKNPYSLIRADEI